MSPLSLRSLADPAIRRQAVELAWQTFRPYVGDSRHNFQAAISGLDRKLSHAAILDGRVVGTYLIRKRKIRDLVACANRAEFTFPDRPVLILHGLALAVDPAHRGQGLGRQLRELPQALGADIVFGVQHKDLNNLEHWLKVRQLVGDVSDAWVTAQVFAEDIGVKPVAPGRQLNTSHNAERLHYPFDDDLNARVMGRLYSDNLFNLAWPDGPVPPSVTVRLFEAYMQGTEVPERLARPHRGGGASPAGPDEQCERLLSTWRWFGNTDRHMAEAIAATFDPNDEEFGLVYYPPWLAQSLVPLSHYRRDFVSFAPADRIRVVSAYLAGARSTEYEPSAAQIWDEGLYGGPSHHLQEWRCEGQVDMEYAQGALSEFAGKIGVIPERTEDETPSSMDDSVPTL